MAVGLLLAHAGPRGVPALEHQAVLLWPQGAPSAVGADDADRPALISYSLPQGQAARSAVVVCPGGGYGMLAMDHEGRQIAEWLNALGIDAYSVGLAQKDPVLSSWPQRLADWMKLRGYLM
jgi:hypothetical protein